MNQSERTHPTGGRTLLAIVMASVLAWGVLLAYGAYLRQLKPWPAIITLACVLAFLEGWLLLLWRRSSRLASARPAALPPPEGVDPPPAP